MKKLIFKTIGITIDTAGILFILGTFWYFKTDKGQEYKLFKNEIRHRNGETE